MINRYLAASAVAILIVGFAPGVASAGPIPPPAERWSSDYNGDGYADVVVGESRPVSGFAGAGAVRVLYGTATGLTATGASLITQSTAGVPSSPQLSAGFGRAIASGDFNGDGYDDAAIGAPGYDNGAGVVVVLYGSSAGLHGTSAAQANAELLTQTGYVPAGVATFQFGAALAVGDVNGDEYADIAIGSPEPGGPPTYPGVTVVYGTANGLQPGANVTFLTKATPGVPGNVGTDYFGLSLAFGDFNGDARDDLAVSAIWTDVSGHDQAGEVYVLFANASGLISGTGAVAYNQDTPGIPDDAEDYDQFGRSLAAGDLTGDGREELIIGNVGEGLPGCQACGIVTVLKGSTTGPVARGSQVFVGTVTGRIGSAVAVARLGGNPYGYLAVGANGYQVDGQVSAGAVVLFPGSATGPTTTGSTVWSQNTPGVPEEAEASDAFGDSLRPIQAPHGLQHLVIGVPLEDLPGALAAGGINVIPGSALGPNAAASAFFGADDLVGGAVSSGLFGFELG